MSKKLPRIKSDEDLAKFMEKDLSAYLNPQKFQHVKFVFTPSLEDLPKTENVHVRFSKPLLKAVKAKAASNGVSYQKYIRRVVETSLAGA
jgi:predicted DNA binding CopG/RHH family protein